MRGWSLLALLSFAAAAGARQVLPAEDLLSLTGQARACYLGFVELYDADYLRQPDAGSEATRCVRVSYRRAFSASALDKATVEVFRERHGAAVAQRYGAQLQRLGEVYASVDPGDRYTYCVVPDAGGYLLRDGHEVIRFPSQDFAERFLGIWVRGEDAARAPQWAFRSC